MGAINAISHRHFVSSGPGDRVPPEMAEPANRAPNRIPGLHQGLSGKLLLLTLLFVMVGEILIFLPSIANFRLNWLKNRIGAR